MDFEWGSQHRICKWFWGSTCNYEVLRMSLVHQLLCWRHTPVIYPHGPVKGLWKIPKTNKQIEALLYLTVCPVWLPTWFPHSCKPIIGQFFILSPHWQRKPGACVSCLVTSILVSSFGKPVNCQQDCFTWASLDSKTYLMGVKDGVYKVFIFSTSSWSLTWTKIIEMGREGERRDKL